MAKSKKSKTGNTRSVPGKTSTAKRSCSRGGGSLAERKKLAGKILVLLKRLYPEVDSALQRDSALQLLVATILSAQSTDETVNQVTPALFARYPAVGDLANAKNAEVEKLIKSTGFFRQKAKSIINASKMIVEKFGGKVPETMDELILLPGVARKTANVVLGTWFGKNEGIVVDTHIGRLAGRLNLTWTSRDGKDAVKIERDMMQLFQRRDWTYLGHALILHGRYVCRARKPNCEGCRLNKLCPSAFMF